MRFSIVTLALLLLVTGGLFFNESSTREGTEQETFSATIDPRVLEILEETNEVVVLISIRMLPIPGFYWSADARREPAAEYQERILDALTDDDFALLYRYGDKPWLIGRITVSGVEKIGHHPYVKGIDTGHRDGARFDI